MRSGTAPRIPPGGRAELGLVNWGIAQVVGAATGGRPPNIFLTLGRHRGLFRAWLRFAARLMPRGTLPRRDSELVILRVAHNCASEYERRQHERIARDAGLSEELIEAVRSDAPAGAFSARQQLILRAVDELHRDRDLGDETWAALSAQLSERELIELCMLTGHYEMLAMTLNSLRVEPDREAVRTDRGLARLVARVSR
jgi:alkylhydroperoxidase family enzyme